MSDDLDDLLGPDPEEETQTRGPGRPKGSASKPKAEKKAPGQAASTGGRADATTIQALHRPVSITFLSEALGMDRKTVTRKLADLPHVAQHRGQTPLYDFRQAVQYLVKPKVNIAEYVRKMGVGDLPMALQKDVWDARLKEQKWRKDAGELWATEDVLEVLGEAFQRLKTTTQLWIDQIGESHALSAAARKELTGMVDGLQSDLHLTLVEMPKDRTTESQVSEISDDEGYA